jgi:group I intron endonuclease
MYTVYLITNTVTDKRYVGITSTSAIDRFKMHLWTKNKKDYFHNAIRKYGNKSFFVETLAVTETRSSAKNLEQCWITLLQTDTKEFGYNSTLGGDAGEIPNEETRRKIGEASSKRRHSPETRLKMSLAHRGEKNHFYGKTHDPETIAAIRVKCKEKLSGANNPWFGKTLSLQHRINISLAKQKAST